MSAEQGSGGNGGTFHVGSVTGGAVSFGAHSKAVYHEAPQGGPALDEATAALLEAVRGLRGELSALAASDATQEAGRELAAAEEEITATGRTGADRLRRLRELAAPGATAVGALASAATVAQAAAQLLG